MTHLDAWRSDTFLLYSCKVAPESKIHHQDRLMLSAQFYGPCLQLVVHSLTCCFPGMCHSFTHPGTSYHVTQFDQAFPRVSTARDKRWGEKAWV